MKPSITPHTEATVNTREGSNEFNDIPQATPSHIRKVTPDVQATTSPRGTWFSKVVLVTLLITSPFLQNCEQDKPVDQVDSNSTEAKLAWLKSLQAADPLLKLDTRVKLDADHDFGIKYEITDVPYSFQIKEVILYESSIKWLRTKADEILTKATNGKPTYDNLFIGTQFVNKLTGDGVTFKVDPIELFSKNEITLNMEDVNVGSNLANSRLFPGNANAYYAGRLSVTPKSATRDIFWNNVSSDQIYQTTNILANSPRIYVGKDFDYNLIIKK